MSSIASFANEVANLCHAFDATADDVLRGIGYDQRIGSQFLRPGIGFGGPCFEKDVKSIEHIAGQYNIGRELFSGKGYIYDPFQLYGVALPAPMSSRRRRRMTAPEPRWDSTWAMDHSLAYDCSSS